MKKLLFFIVWALIIFGMAWVLSGIVTEIRRSCHKYQTNKYDWYLKTETGEEYLGEYKEGD